MSRFPRVLAAGDAALVLELGEDIDPDVNARVQALDAALRERPFPGFRESVPTYRSLLVIFDRARAEAAEVSARLRALGDAMAGPSPNRRRHVIPVRYGGEDGPDLAHVAATHGLTERSVVERHAAGLYTCFMLGFMPGYGYLGTIDEALAMPRRSTPRVRVPAGSVAIAGRQTGVYPIASPGGWHLLGRTSVRMFDPDRDAPSLLLPGDLVTFAPSEEHPERASAAATPAATGPVAVEVVEPGLLTSVQDAGRFGHRRLGIAWAGAMDGPALAAANAAVGNEPGAAGLECTLSGPTLRFLASVPFVVAGADLGATLERADLGAWPVPRGTAVLARAGNVLRFGPRRSGCRAYVAFAGGIDVPEVLGSRSTDLGSAFGGFAGRALRAGDRLALGPRSRRAGRETPPLDVDTRAVVRLRVVLGPQDDHFADETLERFLSQTFDVAATSDRVGCRLLGEPLLHRGASEIASDGMLPGSIQVPPDGRPIVMGVDGPTTGGYPKIATVVQDDLGRLAELVPGESRLRFERA